MMKQRKMKSLRNLFSLAETKTDDETDFVIGPETVFERYPDWNENQLESNRQYQQLANWMMNYKNAQLVFGVSSSKIYTDRKNAPATSRTRNNVTFDVFNTAVFIGRNGEPQIYHKSILVPGVEKMPFMKYLGFLRDIVIDIGGTSGSLGRQEEPSFLWQMTEPKPHRLFATNRFLANILPKYVKKGAELIFIITNDGWWRNTPGYKQHMSFARLRAIETRRSIARAANTGISCFINQRGDVSQATGWWTETAIKGKYKRK